ncbi:hypothetical protein [Halovivax limisalsi]|uniref:hypothetical protein n=1 Tax=Halovivax limisalsi TaxID=1453760 RepID=UPI001FFCD25F|nr:hypothetical protein [Halovivax limisalsi]
MPDLHPRRLRSSGALVRNAIALAREDPRAFAMALDRRWYHRRYGHLGDEFVDADWDTLVIMDAARPDILRDLDPFDAPIEDRYSPGSYSKQFMERQFNGRQLHDTVYVTANPHVHDVEDGVFHAIENLLETHWDEDLETVPPEAVTSAGLAAFETYPDKRLVVHFMQPHFPFIGPVGRTVPAGIGTRIDDRESPHPWQAQSEGRGVGRERLRRAYRENHRVVLPNVRALVERLPGRTVVTADHANLIGERGFPVPIRLYGHPVDFPHPDLLRVPWVRFDGEPRAVTAEAPVERASIETDVVRDRLESLGYA